MTIRTANLFVFINILLIMVHNNLSIANEILVFPNININNHSYEDIFTINGYTRENSQILSNVLYKKNSAVSGCVLFNAEIIEGIKLHRILLIIRVINAISGVTFYQKTFEFEDGSKYHVKEILRNSIVDFDKLINSYNDKSKCDELSVSATSDKLITLSGKEFVIDFENKITMSPRLNFVDDSFRRDVFAIQDYVSNNSGGINSYVNIDGHLCPVEVKLNFRDNNGNGFKCELNSANDGAPLGETTITSDKDIDKAIGYIEQNVDKRKLRNIDTKNIIRLR